MALGTTLARTVKRMLRPGAPDRHRERLRCMVPELPGTTTYDRRMSDQPPPNWGGPPPPPQQPGGGPVPPPSYGQQPPPPGYQAYGGSTTTKHPQGTLILVFGIVGLVTCLPLAIAAVVMGQRAMNQMNANPGVVYTNRGQVNAGRICGIVGCAIAVIYFIVVLATR